MSEQRFRPSNGGGNRPPARVPVTRPVGRQTPQAPQQPTQSFEREEPQTQSRPYQQPQGHGYQEQPQQTRMGVPPMMDFEEEYMEEEGKKSKSKLVRNLTIGFVALLVILGGIFAATKLLGNDDVPLVDGSKVTEGENTNPLSEKAASPTGETTEVVDFDGNPIPIKWPADVKPTRMEIQLDPSTGKPVLLLVGDKSGLGTVIRSYQQDGKLSGYWVIVPDSQEQQAEQTEETKTEDQNSGQ